MLSDTLYWYGKHKYNKKKQSSRTELASSEKWEQVKITLLLLVSR